VRADPVFDTVPLPPDSLRERTVVITGASDGIGRALSERCAQAGARVVMVGRNAAKTTHAANVIMNRTGSRRVTVEIADLLYLEEQHALGERLVAAHPAIFALVNNAGAIFLERQLTRDGLERTFALNHVAYATLALHVLPSLIAGALPNEPARLINVASRAHVRARFEPDNLQGEREYSGWSAYSQSKLANILFTRALATRVDSGALVVHALHPGLVASRFAANNGHFGRLQRRVMDWFSVSAMAGSDTAAWLLASPEAAHESGAYWVQRKRVEPSESARDARAAELLWDGTIALAGLQHLSPSPADASLPDGVRAS
jgi:NAD(P)-dependent dehydrogenase (short-subunit alcohol dehydrogenase family)